jgi:hypothetical protein
MVDTKMESASKKIDKSPKSSMRDPNTPISPFVSKDLSQTRSTSLLRKLPKNSK